MAQVVVGLGLQVMAQMLLEQPLAMVDLVVVLAVAQVQAVQQAQAAMESFTFSTRSRQ
jgi:hypothetical protein